MYYVNKYIVDRKYLTDATGYDYMIIDEYQDISDGEYNLARNTADRSNAKVFAVGDDWQSIYAFRGSNIGYITKFDKYFVNPTILEIKTTYRNSQELIDIAGEFIKENPNQIDKNLISFKHLPNPIHFVNFNDYDEIDPKQYDYSKEYQILKNLIFYIHKIVPDHSILILARNNKMIDDCFRYNEDFIQDINNKIKIESIEDLQLEGMTIHKAKGLTYDEVIIIGMNKRFPDDNHYDHWLVDLFKNKPLDEDIRFAEERRLFYVALTRTKNNVFILANTNPEHRSEFVDELVEICRKNNR